MDVVVSAEVAHFARAKFIRMLESVEVTHGGGVTLGWLMAWCSIIYKLSFFFMLSVAGAGCIIAASSHHVIGLVMFFSGIVLYLCAVLSVFHVESTCFREAMLKLKKYGVAPELIHIYSQEYWPVSKGIF